MNPMSDVGPMFDRIAHRYDFLNRLLSFRQDLRWRRKTINFLPQNKNITLLDLATGTGDLIITLAPHFKTIVGLDLSSKMLGVAAHKLKRNGNVSLKIGDALAIPESDESFEVVTMAFGIRNVLNVEGALAEIRRVLIPKGRLIILEFSMPKNAIIRWGYLLYFRRLLPSIGAFFSGDAKAYRYLNSSVEQFPYGEAFCKLMSNAGFSNVKAAPLTFGVATIYSGDK
jgi:demethylmenaquinone methyltransferase/2-methoxy-6-polyprenyl-1,4-benzoquinol methylase